MKVIEIDGERFELVPAVLHTDSLSADYPKAITKDGVFGLRPLPTNHQTKANKVDWGELKSEVERILDEEWLNKDLGCVRNRINSLIDRHLLNNNNRE